jgi:hypothetical protein
VALACLVAAAAIAVAATVDHHVKITRVNRAQVADWYCRHRGTECGGPSFERIESRWNQREWVYAFSFALFAGYGAVRLLSGVFDDRATPADPAARSATEPNDAPP